MRYAGIVIKAVSLILISILFVLFLIYAAGFGEDGNMLDLAMSNILVSSMILVLIVSAVASLGFDFYEKSKWQNEKVFGELNEKISHLEELEPKIQKITEENFAKTAQIIDDFSQKLAENSAKTQEFMTQFANLSVQVFAKDKQAQNMEHQQNDESSAILTAGNDYFNHYTNEPEIPEDILPSVADNAEILPPEDDAVEILQPTDKADFSASFESEVSSEEIVLPPENENDASVSVQDFAEEKSVDEMLKDSITDSSTNEQSEQNKLSDIFNQELADTLADLEIMKDDDNKQSAGDIDLSAYFADSGKIKL